MATKKQLTNEVRVLVNLSTKGGIVYPGEYKRSELKITDDILLALRDKVFVTFVTKEDEVKHG